MLRKETVSTVLLEILCKLMEMETLMKHRLVGGTALALQIGHRISVDIDLFSETRNNYTAIEDELSMIFGKLYSKHRYIRSPLGHGISIALNGIKVDILDWSSHFIRPCYVEDKIRMATKEDIILMKFNTFICQPEFARYEKKDYIDLAYLMREFSIDDMIGLYKNKYPLELMVDRLMIEGLQLSELADKRIMPKMLKIETWEDIKSEIENLISVFIEKKLRNY